jgi:hypothetical protein
VSVRRFWILFCALALAIGLAACGQEREPVSTENDGVYIDAGPITYQLQVSRELNQYGTEDREYLIGLPSGDTATGLTASQMWYGVFLWAKNQTDQAHPSTDRFVIVDTQGDRYYPVALDSSINQYAWTSQLLQPGATQPTPGSTAYYGPTQGGLLLFKLPTTVYANRPLTLLIYAPGQAQPSQIALDL